MIVTCVAYSPHLSTYLHIPWVKVANHFQHPGKFQMLWFFYPHITKMHLFSHWVNNRTIIIIILHIICKNKERERFTLAPLPHLDLVVSKEKKVILHIVIFTTMIECYASRTKFSCPSNWIE